jgi:hypothetical protein
MRTPARPPALILPDAGLTALGREVARFGGAGVETGAFLIGEPTEIRPAVLALAGQVGIGRSPRQFRVSAAAIAVLFDWVGNNGWRIFAQVHSHAGQAFLSESDLRHGFAVDGFVTAIVPRFADPPVDPTSWGWWRFSQQWLPIPAPDVHPGEIQVVRFDETGVEHG